jgi:hypothetical protein
MDPNTCTPLIGTHIYPSAVKIMTSPTGKYYVNLWGRSSYQTGFGRYGITPTFNIPSAGSPNPTSAKIIAALSALKYFIYSYVGSMMRINYPLMYVQVKDWCNPIVSYLYYRNASYAIAPECFAIDLTNAQVSVVGNILETSNSMNNMLAWKALPGTDPDDIDNIHVITMVINLELNKSAPITTYALLDGWIQLYQNGIKLVLQTQPTGNTNNWVLSGYPSS